MPYKYTILIFAALFVVLIFCSQHPSNNFDIHSHNIQLFFNPKAQSLTAIDSIGIRYHKSTENIYFLLHDSLTLEKIAIGHQSFEFFRSGPDDEEFKKMFNSEKLKDASLYKVKIPVNLRSEERV